VSSAQSVGWRIVYAINTCSVTDNADRDALQGQLIRVRACARLRDRLGTARLP
jgi:hypothetical protein